MPAKRSWAAVIAVAWLISAVLLTLVFSRSLGQRGLFWLWVHNLLCVAGVLHELVIKRRLSS